MLELAQKNNKNAISIPLRYNLEISLIKPYIQCLSYFNSTKVQFRDLAVDLIVKIILISIPLRYNLEP